MKKYLDVIIISIFSTILIFGYPLLLFTGIINLNVFVYKLMVQVIYPTLFLGSSLYYNITNKKIKLTLPIILIIIFGINILLFYNITAWIYMFVNICCYILGILISNLINRK
jgi:hypothetical protein